MSAVEDLGNLYENMNEDGDPIEEKLNIHDMNLQPVGNSNTILVVKRNSRAKNNFEVVTLLPGPNGVTIFIHVFV